MKFIKPRLVFLTVTLLLGACAGRQFNPAPVEPRMPLPEPAALVAQSTQGAQAQTAIDPYLQNRPPVPVEVEQQYQRALDALTREDWASAERMLQQLASDHPRLSGPQLNLGILYQRRDQPERAERAYKAAIAANRNNSVAYNQLGVLLREQGRFSEAEEYYLKALGIWERNAQAHLNLGILYELYLGRLRQALDHYHRYQQLGDEPDTQVAGWIIDLQRRVSPALTSE